MRKVILWLRTSSEQFYIRPIPVAMLVICFAVARSIPIGVVEEGASICIYKALFGHECIGCGQTRAFFHLIHGDIAGAYHHNKLSPIVFLLLGYIGFKWSVRANYFGSRMR